VSAELLYKAVEARFKVAGNSRQQQRAALKGLPADFHEQLSAFLDFPWMISSGVDAV